MCDWLKDVETRLDLRHIAVCSIDPPGCTDIDDALHWRLLENGNYEVPTKTNKQTNFVIILNCAKQNQFSKGHQ